MRGPFGGPFFVCGDIEAQTLDKKIDLMDNSSHGKDAVEFYGVCGK
jgi:hypothetical protein